MTPTTTIDTASEPGSWAETLASASCGIKVVDGLHPLVRFYCQRNGIPLDHEAIPAMNAEVLAVFAADDGSDHIQSRSALSAAGTGASKFPPVNSPAAADNQGGGLCVSSEEITS